MIIRFLGTSHGYPENGRACSSTMLEVGGKYYLIDAGAPIVNRLVDTDKTIEDVKAVFITHSHGDHLHGLFDLIRCVNIAKIFPNAEIDYYLPEAHVVDAFRALFLDVTNEIREDVNRFHIFSAGVIFEDENIKVTAIPTAHIKNRPSYAFLVEAEGKRVLFTGDLSQRLAKGDFPKVASETELDAVICEMAHFGMEELTPCLDTCRTKAVYFNHVNRHAEKLPTIEAANASGRFPFPLVIAADGDEVDL